MTDCCFLSDVLSTRTFEHSHVLNRAVSSLRLTRHFRQRRIVIACGDLPVDTLNDVGIASRLLLLPLPIMRA